MSEAFNIISYLIFCGLMIPFYVKLGDLSKSIALLTQALERNAEDIAEQKKKVEDHSEKINDHEMRITFIERWKDGE